MFIVQGISCMPDILAAAEISGVDIEGTEFNTRIQGGILCDGLGSMFAALGTTLPLVAQAGNVGTIVVAGCAVGFPFFYPLAHTLTTHFGLDAPAGRQPVSLFLWAL